MKGKKYILNQTIQGYLKVKTVNKMFLMKKNLRLNININNKKGIKSKLLLKSFLWETITLIIILATLLNISKYVYYLLN